MFKGSYTAIVTPFRDRKVDEAALKTLVEDQIKGGINGIVPCGTTGETPTLSDDERDLVISTTVKVANKRVPVIAGTGSNSTAHTIHYTKRAKELGADAALVVVPYYNKPTQEGLYQHFMAVAKEGGLPVMLYNVPGRTGCDLLADTVVRLQADEPRIVAIKEAAGSTDRVAELRARTRKDFSILSGDDALTLPMMAVGADGVVSVASNVVPDKVAQMVKAAQENDFAKARALHLQLRDLFVALFVEANPIPAKAALAQLGKMQDELRLPLVPASDKTRQLMKTVLQALGR
ncbi:MAG: 4-hydroxy-tetrahydrodipicolinate synthase [Deltaproteobacteria bacterium]|nr:4-hydroxy-tetrahydrodipicolinate synthase [Deltaproteobacteria bacterium]